jgi:D-alanyl-D-alanine carboxypeptidase (penicillin-binding protein 5/6)
MNNWNRMLESWIPIGNLYAKMYAYEGLDGLKTGHTNTAGYNFTGTAVRNGLRLISVVMKTENEDMRFGETRKLLDYGFNNFEKRTVIVAKTEMEQLPSVKIKRGKALEVPLVTQSGLELIMKKDETNDVLDITAETVDEELLVAPIKQGDVLGTLTVKYGKDVVHTINLVAAEDVDKAGWFTLFLRAIGNFFKDIWNSILNIF